MIPHIPTFSIPFAKTPHPSPPSPSPSQSPPRCPPRIHPIHTATRVHFTNRTNTLTTPAWRFILLSDGHIHNLLSILTEHPLPLTLISTESLAHPPASRIPLPESLPPAPCIRRTITLDGPDGKPLLHASSLWNRAAYERVMRGRERSSLFRVFSELRLEVSRAVLAVHYATCDDLCDVFGTAKGETLWARDYVFRQDKVPFLMVQEVLSPRLDRYLGEIVPPSHLREDVGEGGVVLGEDGRSRG